MPGDLYDRDAAAAYAKRWALARNPDYYDFSLLGGDCTNFISQCLFAGCGIMNHTELTGWFYFSPNKRSAAWTSASYLSRFLLGNRGPGPYARAVSQAELAPGDLIQLATEDRHIFHSLFVLDIRTEIMIAAHSEDALYRPLISYNAPRKMYLKIFARE